MNDEILDSAPEKAVVCVVGTRPNFMKIAPIMRVLREGPKPVPTFLVHTGQHYDTAMKTAFFRQLDIPEPDLDLEVGSASHAVQTAEIMKSFDRVLDAVDPSAVLVVGDVNSTIACALVAAKKDVPVIHVEAGLRSFDRRMPEEINRVLTDQLSELLFTTEASARENLLREGIAENRIHFVGNVMIDTLLYNRERAVPKDQSLKAIAGKGGKFEVQGPYAVVTLHRPSNVDLPDKLKTIVETLNELSAHLPVVFPVHPRTRSALVRYGLEGLVEQSSGIISTPPLGYLEMLGLMANARMVLTDSGGIQEETTVLGVPCITLRDNTERPVTVEQGTNTITGTDPVAILGTARAVLNSQTKAARVPELWDGKAAHRIREVLVEWLESQRQV